MIIRAKHILRRALDDGIQSALDVSPLPMVPNATLPTDEWRAVVEENLDRYRLHMRIRQRVWTELAEVLRFEKTKGRPENDPDFEDERQDWA